MEVGLVFGDISSGLASNVSFFFFPFEIWFSMAVVEVIAFPGAERFLEIAAAVMGKTMKNKRTDRRTILNFFFKHSLPSY